MTDWMPGQTVVNELIDEWAPLTIEFPEIAPGLARQELELFHHWLLVHGRPRWDGIVTTV